MTAPNEPPSRFIEPTAFYGAFRTKGQETRVRPLTSDDPEKAKVIRRVLKRLGKLPDERKNT